MSEPVELAFRNHLAAAFSEDLGQRIYDLAYPPNADYPLAVYRRTGSGIGTQTPEARIQVTLEGPSYTELKRLQHRMEEQLAMVKNTWLGGPDYCVWVFLITPTTMPDGYMGSTRHRRLVTEYVIKYQHGR